MPELRFLCIGDTHGVVPDALPEGRFDAILHAGDIDDQRALRELERMARRRRLPLMYVMGNHDAAVSPDTAIDLTGRALRIADGLVIAGIGCAIEGELLPSDGEIEKACVETLAAIRAMKRKDDTLILLTHYPPLLEGSDAYSASAQGVLSRDVGRVMCETEPLVLIHGHVHALQCHQEIWRGTMIACAGPDWGVLTIDAEAGTATYCPWV